MLSDLVVDLSGTVSYATDIFVDISVYINALATKTHCCIHHLSQKFWPG